MYGRIEIVLHSLEFLSLGFDINGCRQSRVQKFRDELQVMRLQFDNSKKEQEQKLSQANRRDLLGARPARSGGASPVSKKTCSRSFFEQCNKLLIS